MSGRSLLLFLAHAATVVAIAGIAQFYLRFPLIGSLDDVPVDGRARTRSTTVFVLGVAVLGIAAVFWRATP